MEKLKVNFYKIMSALFFVVGIAFGMVAFNSGNQSSVIGSSDPEAVEEGYYNLQSTQVEYKLFLSAVIPPWILCAFFGYCDTKKDIAEAIKLAKEAKELIKK